VFLNFYLKLVYSFHLLSSVGCFNIVHDRGGEGRGSSLLGIAVKLL
jgi:hypothetical protein